MTGRIVERVHTIYLGLGTNLGDRQHNLSAAVKGLAPKVTVTAQSKVYETPAWGYEDQPAFLNAAVKAETELHPEELLAFLKELEVKLGRTATFRWGPRLIDIDILFYDDLVAESPTLVVPHPHLQERAFVLLPLLDIAPDMLHPVIGKTVRQMLETLGTGDIRPA